jgi:uncharacterized protein
MQGAHIKCKHNDPLLEKMTPRDQDIALELKQRIEEYTPIQDYRVFGSRARGDETPESDLDVFIKVEHMNPSVRQRISECAWEIGFNHDLVISTFVAECVQIDDGLLGASPIIHNIMKEGVRF